MSEVAINVEEEAQTVAGLLREYAGKLAEYNTEMAAVLNQAVRQAVFDRGRMAWLLDRFEMTSRPLQRILARGSGLLEHAALGPLTRDELDLRLRELEAHLHHAARQTRQLHGVLEKDREAPEVAKLRYAAGLPAVKAGAAS